ncbi:MAG: hypothetical protein MZW92_29920 [Comamonadaceae bacterium]|nr:hypothetical protein [Comamonadaceae bacterium]
MPWSPTAALRAAAPEPLRPTIPGKFVWHDLLTTDSPAVEKFYAGLFGWTFEAQKGRENPYKAIRLAGVPIGGIVDVSAMKSDMPSSTWLNYVSVADVDKAVAAMPEPELQGPARARARRLQRQGCRGRRPAGRHPGPRQDHEGRPSGRGPRSRGVLPLDGVRGRRRRSRPRVLQGRPWIHRGSGRRRRERGATSRSRRGDDREPGSTRAPGRKSVPTGSRMSAWRTPRRRRRRPKSLGGRILLAPKPEVRNGTLAIVTDPSGAALALQKWPIDEPAK